MRILLDECVDEALRRPFEGHECQTCRYAGLSGLSNGQLLAAADAAGFQVLLTVDRKMASQQSLRGKAISIVVPSAKTTNYEDLLLLLPDVLRCLDSISRGEVAHIGGQ
jgi:hypothetical protein